MTFESRLIDCWYDGPGSARCRWCHCLWPLSFLFRLAVAARRALYVHGWLPATRLPVPVVVVGNVTVGGTGKTPLVIWLARRLRAAGYHPGVVSRGYGGKADEPRPVTADSDAAQVGDEPVLIARRAGCPVWVGRRRGAAARALLAAEAGVDVLISDDGLQHHALARDLEIVLVDGERGLGNGLPLPAGPLREPADRLDRVDAIVVNGAATRDLSSRTPTFAMRLRGDRFRNLHEPDNIVSAAYFTGRDNHMLAGIGHPARFFAMIEAMGVVAKAHAFPDHHDFKPGDLPAGTLIMTEKDAVKCAPLVHADAWLLPVDAEVDEGLETLILDRVKSHHGQQAA